jgi:hypothetical protein
MEWSRPSRSLSVAGSIIELNDVAGDGRGSLNETILL